MRKLPDCPKCGEPELWVNGNGPSMKISCYECGWNTTIMLPMTAETIGDKIAAAVKAAQSPVAPD